MGAASWADADLLGDFVWRASGILLVLIALLVLQILIAGVWLDHRRRHLEALRRRWEPILADAAGGADVALPPLARRDRMAFLRLWTYVQELVLGDARDRLADIAHRVGVVELARRRLLAGRPGDRLIAITAVGHLRDDGSWPTLEAIAVRDRSAIRSLAAVHSLFRIDPGRAARLVTPHIATRADWSLSGLARILAEAGPDAISEPLAEAARTASPGHAPRLIRLLQLAHGHEAVAAVHRILAGATDTEVVTACLRVVEDPRDLDRVRVLAEDARWQVRVQAIGALARMGTRDDEPRMVAALEDREWWVRYRAAQGLATAPFMTEERLRRLAREVPGRFARDILGQVIAERTWA